MADDASPTPARRGPIFIVGAMGSGTTLLRLMLDSHDRIAIPAETGFMRGYDAIRFTPFKYSGGGWWKRLGWTRPELDALMRELYDRLFMRYAEQHGKVRWGDKTPLHTWHIDDIAQVFPDAQIVVVVRHPAASVASNMSRFGTTQRWASLHWRRTTAELSRQAPRHADRMAFVRYEDLVLRPDATLHELLDWLGEPWSDSVLRHHEIQAERKRKRHKGTAPWDVRRPEGRIRPDDALDVSRIDKWTRTMKPGQKERATRRLHRWADLYGYAMDDPSPKEPLARDGSLVATGADIAARLAAVPDLDLERYATRALHDKLLNPRHVKLMSVEEYEALHGPRGARRVGIEMVRRVPVAGARRPLIRTGRRLARTGRRLRRRF